MDKGYIKNGAIAALLDEYEKAIGELVGVIGPISPNELMRIVDANTDDEDCKSIQSILSHVVQSGYTYVIEIRKWLGEEIDYEPKKSLENSSQYKTALSEMFAFNEKLFIDYPDLELETYNPAKKITVGWGQVYDVEQLFEHAIVHILRHRRQIEKFIQQQ